MIAIILAGGYAKRLGPLSLHTPKPLLPLARRPIIDYVTDTVSRLGPSIEKLVVLTSSRFRQQFGAWARSRNERIEVVSDGSRSEEDKPGAVGALAAFSSKITSDFLVIASDCLYLDELQGLVSYFREKQAPVVALYHAVNTDQVKRGSAVKIDEEGRIVDFIEKPRRPRTELAGTALYLFPLRIRHRLTTYIHLGLPRDQPGHFIQWLHHQEPVYGHLLQHPISYATKRVSERVLSVAYALLGG